MSRYRSVSEPRLYLFAVVMSVLAVFLIYVQAMIDNDMIQRLVLIISAILIITTMVSVMASHYNY